MQPIARPSPRTLPWAETAVLAVTAAWGLSFVVLRTAQADAGPFALTALRMATGLATALVLLRPRLLTASALEWKGGIAGGVLLSAGYLLQTAGMRTAGAGTGGFITAFYVALVPLIEAAVFRRLPDRRDLLVLLVCCLGIGMIALDGATWALPPGEALVALSAPFWAAQIVVVGRVAARVHAPTLTVIQLLTLVAVCGAGALVVDEKPIRWTTNLLASVFFLGHVTCTLAFLAQAWAQRRFPPTHAAILFSPEPVFAALFGWWLLGEQFGLREVAGGALVLGAVLWAVLRTAPPADTREAAGDGTLTP